MENNNSIEMPDWRWGLIGNIVEERPYGEADEIRRGTKRFPPGAKVYLALAKWSDGYERVVVIGKPRRKRRYIKTVASIKHIENFRLQKIYKPEVLRLMNKDDLNAFYWWDNTDADRDLIISYVENLNGKDI